MSTIKILPESLANQIAAGEVVERPASVVKELLENALDAGAKQISVQIEGDGSRLIRVIDDGCGMDADDVLLCLERHATSKLRSVEELAAIHSLGFRGEAIPSIASVCRLLITSRPREAELGTLVDIRYGRLEKIHEMGCAEGTTFEVKSLFGNVPARRKFLKSPRTELAHIEDILRNMALMFYEVGFLLELNGKKVFEVHGGEDSFKERFRKAFSGNVPDDLVDLDSTGHPLCESHSIHIKGFLLPPDDAYGSAGKLRLFVNGRNVSDRTIFHGINEGLQGFLMKGRRASGALFLELPPETVDVNVHPTKQEIRFRQSSIIHEAVRDTVRSGIEAFQGKLKETLFGNATDVNPRTAADRLDVMQRTVLFPESRFESDRLAEPDAFWDRKMPAEDHTARQALEAPCHPHAEPGTAISEPGGGYEANQPLSSFAGTTSPSPVRQAEASSPEELPLRYIGQLLDTYILCQSGRTLVAIDQHAAQERLLYETLLEQYCKKEVPRQTLLFSTIVDLDAKDIQLLEQFSDEISRLGLELQEFGGGSYVVKAVPASLAHVAPLEVLRGILARFTDSSDGKNAARRIEDVIADLACKAAIKANRKLTGEETRQLLRDLQASGVFSHCPHGRPVARRFSENEIKRWFFRG